MYMIYKKVKASRERKRQQQELGQTMSTEPAKLQRTISEKQELCSHQQEALRQSELQSGQNQGDAISTNPATIPSSNTPWICETCVAEKKAHRNYSWRLLITLLIPNFMASMDVTIVATALPTIASHFNKLDQFNWVVTAFTIVTTSFVPIYGQLADVFGRHVVMQFAILMILIGSVLCAAAQDWPMLLLGRAIQGLGFAGLQTVTDIILADRVSLKENSRNVTIFDFVNGFSFGVGPTIGGYLTKANWRWVFILNLPIAVIAHILLFFFLRHDLVGPQPQRIEDRNGKVTLIERKGFFSKLAVIDHGGIVLFFFGIGLVVLGLSWGGNDHSWNSPAVISTLVIGGVLLLTFVLWEYLMEPGRLLSRFVPKQEAMIPWSIFESKEMALLAYLNFSTGMALYSVFYFMGLYFNIAKAYDSGKSGLQLLFYLPGLGAGVYLAMALCNFWPKHTFWPLWLGSWIEPLGIGLLTWSLNTGNVSVISGMLVVAGLGTGLRFMPGTLHALGVMSKRKSRVLAVMSFCIPFGGTVGIAVMSTVFNNKLTSFLPEGYGSSNPTSSGEISRLPPDVADLVRDAVRRAVYWSYISIIPFLALAGVAGFFLGDVKITDAKQDEEGQLMHTENVVDRPYLWYLVTGKRRNDTQAVAAEESGQRHTREKS